MQKYNFEPDYEKWWKKKDLTKEKLCWLMLGASPTDISNSEKLDAKGDSCTHEERLWNCEFKQYLDTLSSVRRVGEVYRQSVKMFSWHGDKIAFIKQAYEGRVDFANGFVAFLDGISCFPRDNNLEKYKDHQRYKLEQIPLDISSEQDAFALLLGLKPEDFQRFYDLAHRQNNGPMENGLAPYARFTPDEKWFYSEYRDFISTSCQMGEDFSIIHAWNEARFLEVWENDFSKYAQRLYNEGFIFKASVVDTLKALGIELKYDEKSWAYDFYHYWIKKGGWTTYEAICLFKGEYPDKTKGRSFIDLSQNPWVLHSFPDGAIYAWNNYTLDIEPLEGLFERHKAVGTLQPYPMKDVMLFKPKEITKWLLEQTIYIPPEPLLLLLKINETKKEEEKRLLENTAALTARTRTKRKPRQIHGCIGWAWNQVKKADNGKPAAQDVWKKLQENSSIFPCIVRFDVSKKTKEEAIIWETETGIESEMSLSTFKNVVSDLNMRRRTYDPSQNNF